MEAEDETLTIKVEILGFDCQVSWIKKEVRKY